jgi:N-acetylmuramoyl-L-alanine amidase
MAERRKVIVLDPAHGGDADRGGSSWRGGASGGADPILEKDVSLALARAVKQRLDGTHSVTLTRDRDENLSLAERAKHARDLGADLFVSIHFNAALDPAVDGTESWVAHRASPASQTLAQSIPRRVARAAGIEDRGVRHADFGVLLPSRHDPRTAACLVEVAFLTNPGEAARLRNPDYFGQIADALSDAVRGHAASATSTAWMGEALGTQGPGAALGDSVGKKPSANKTADVMLVQKLLNTNLPLPPTPLSENGSIDAATITAIEEYQRKALGIKTPDGQISPNGVTFKSLNADKFSFMPHRCQPLTGASAAVDAARMNPGFLTPTGVTRNAGLQNIVNRRVLSDPKLKQLRFALVDLTGSEKLASPQLAGNNETVQGGLGSMSKIAAMYAAFQLKFDLEELARQKGLKTQKDLFDAARQIWADVQKPDPKKTAQLFPKDPKVETQGQLVVVDGKPLPLPQGLALPDLDKIFTVIPTSSGVTLRFTGSDKILMDPAVPGSPPDESSAVRSYVQNNPESLGDVRKLSFAERMFLMIDESDNAAAHSCIENIGYAYTHSAIWQCDFYRPERGGGLWEASTHDDPKLRWIKPPVPRGNPAADFVSATPCSVAALLTLMEQNRLVNSNSCAGMKHLMDKQKTGVPLGSHTRSYFLEGLQGFTLDRIHSKLGIGTHRNDCAIVVRTVRPDPSDRSKDKQIRYIAVGNDDPTATTDHLHKLIVEFDKCIRENNGLLSATAP